MTRIFDSYGPFIPEISRAEKGALISMAGGQVTAYALSGLEARGILFVGPGEEVRRQEGATAALPLSAFLLFSCPLVFLSIDFAQSPCFSLC